MEMLGYSGTSWQYFGSLFLYTDMDRKSPLKKFMIKFQIVDIPPDQQGTL